jgi:hypothetical protein
MQDAAPPQRIYLLVGILCAAGNARFASSAIIGSESLA